MNSTLVVIISVVVAVSSCIAADANDGTQSSQGRTFALVVGGVIRDAEENLKKRASISVLEGFFSGPVKIEQQNIQVLTDTGSGRISDEGRSTADNIKIALEALAGAIKPEDRFVFYYIGQANVVGQHLRLNLSGEDITQDTLSKWLKPVRASSILIVLDCPGAGLAAKALAGKGRVIVCACESEQHYSTQLSDFFIPALQDLKADSNSDSRVSMLEAFTWASRQVDDWYRQKKLLTTETPVLEDDGDGVPSKRPWRYETSGTDGGIASGFFLIPKEW